MISRRFQTRTRRDRSRDEESGRRSLTTTKGKRRYLTAASLLVPRSNRGPVSRSILAKWLPELLLPVPPHVDHDGDRGDDGENDSDAEDIVTGAQCPRCWRAQCPRPNGWTAGILASCWARLCALAQYAVWRCCSWWTFARSTDTALWCPGDVAARERVDSSRSRTVSRRRDTLISYLEK